MRTQRVVVAIVQDDLQQFLIAYNHKWDGYAFPMKAVPEGGNILGSLAIQAVEGDLGIRLPDATATELDHMCSFGKSQRTGEETLYEYWLFMVNPVSSLNLKDAPGPHPPIFLTKREILDRNDLTWSTPKITHEFIENQDVVLSVVNRPGQTETEFLLVWNESYRGYFFPAQRVKTEVKPAEIAGGTIIADLDYRGPSSATLLGEITDIHASNRFLEERRYRFFVCDTQLPEIDLHQPCNVLEQALNRRKKKFLWVPASQLNDPANRTTSTMAALHRSVASMIPKRTFSGQLRRSEGGIALIERVQAGKKEWLAQWNDNWRAFFFVGGHREVNESFRECVVREIEEELALTESECPVDASPAHHLEYRAISRSAGVLTEYTMELFPAHPTANVEGRIAQNPQNKWLDVEEIRRLETYDGRRVSVTVSVLLSLAKLIHNDCE